PRMTSSPLVGDWPWLRSTVTGRPSQVGGLTSTRAIRSGEPPAAAQSVLPGPGAISWGLGPNDRPLAVNVVYPVPAGLIRAMVSVLPRMNQRLPSSPAVMPLGLLPWGMGKSVNVLVPITYRMTPGWAKPVWVNQRLPSGPMVSWRGPTLPWGMSNGVDAP